MQWIVTTKAGMVVEDLSAVDGHMGHSQWPGGQLTIMFLPLS